MLYKAPIRSRIKIKLPIAQPEQRIFATIAELSAVKTQLLKLEADHKKTIESNSLTLDQKVAEIESYKKKFTSYLVQAEALMAKTLRLAEEIKTTKKGEPGQIGQPGRPGPKPSTDELLNLITPLIPKVEHGKTPSQAELIDLIKPLIPIIPEAVQPPPVDTEEILNLVAEKIYHKKFKIEHIEGLEQTLSALRGQLSRGYLHGGGLSAVSHDSTLAGDGTAKNPLTVLGSGSFVDNEIVSGSGTSFTLANTPVLGSEHIFGNGQRLTPGVGNDYTISGKNITTAISFSTSAVLADYRI